MSSVQPLSNSSQPLLDFFYFDMCKGKGLEEGRYIWAFFGVLCFAVGFPASVAILLEMFHMLRRGAAITPNDFFMLNLSVMDAGFLLFIPPGLVNNFLLKIWNFEVVWGGVYNLNQSGRPLLMACICLDCYFAVVHPIAYRQMKSLKPRILMAVTVWMVTVSTGILFSFFADIYFSLIPYVPLITSLIIILICDSCILYKLMKSYPGGVNIHPQKLRAVQILINSLVVGVVSYLPPVVLFLVGHAVITSDRVLTCTVSIPITITSTLGSAVLPILYLNNIGKLDRFRFACCRSS